MVNVLFGILTILVILGIGFALSESRKKINWRTVGVGLLTQAVIIFLVLKTSIGATVLRWISTVIEKVISFGNEGLAFVFGGFATDNYSFFINVLCMICYISAVVSLLYYLGIIPLAVKWIGTLLSKLLGTTPVETFGAVSCAIFSGTESPLLIEPYLSKMTRSEIFSLVLGGFASASVSIIAGYTLLGVPIEYLLLAMATVPFSTLLMAKLLIPETEKSELTEVELVKSDACNVFEAIGKGANNGMSIAVSVAATLIGFLGVVGVINYLLGFIGQDSSSLLGLIFTPVAWLFNIPAEEVSTFATLIGTKTALNEYVAFTDMSTIINTLSPRTLAILSVALCNFANFSVIGIQVAFYNAVCPSKRAEVSKLGIKALIGGLLTTLLTAAVVGMFF